jgi:hypothetical protein
LRKMTITLKNRQRVLQTGTIECVKRKTEKKN